MKYYNKIKKFGGQIRKEMIYMENKKSKFISWVKKHRVELIVSGISVASLILIILHYNGSVDDLFNMIRNKTLNKNINNENLAQVFNLQPITENKIKGDIEISVKEHIRKLPKGCHASPTKIKEAFSKGIDISDGSSTLVRSYTRNAA